MSNNGYKSIIDNAPYGYALYKVLTDDQGNAENFICIEANTAFEKMTGLKTSKIINKKVTDVLPEIKNTVNEWINLFGDIAINGGEKEFEQFIEPLNKWYKVFAKSSNEDHFYIITTDITNNYLVAEALNRFNQFSINNIDFEYITKIMHQISGAKYTALNIFDESGQEFSTVSIVGANKNIKQANIILGFNIENKKWKFDPVKAKKIQNSKTTCFATIADMAENIIPKKLTQLIQNTFNIGNTYVIKTCKGNVILGDFILIFEKGKELKDKAVAENFADSVGIMLRRVYAEREILLNKEKFKKLTENISDVVWTTDLNLTISYVSPSVYQLTGYTPEEYKKLPLVKRHPEIFHDYFFSIIAKDLELESKPGTDPGRTQLLQAEHYHKNGSVKWLEMNVSYLRDNEGKPIGFQGVSRDITKLKLASDAIIKREEQYRLIFENTPAGILHFNNEGVIIECNDFFVNIIGSSKEILIGLNMTNLPDQNIVKAVNKVKAGESAYYEGLYKSTTANKTTPVRVLFSPVFDSNDNITGGVGIVEDRTALHQQDSLEKQISVAKESVKFKQNFLANMSHEIRTPLTGIMGMTEILQQTPLNDQQTEYLNILKHTGENLMEIINQVLDYSKIEAGKVTLNKKLMSLPLLFDNLEKFFNSINNKDIAIETRIDSELPEYINADEFRINQVINNLLSNAVKFTDKGKIFITAELVKSPDGQIDIFSQNSKAMMVKMSVSDTGFGIPEDKQKSLFRPFSQLEDADNRTHEGSGLGLSICKQIIEMHGGEIGLKSKPGKGSTFWFTFLTESPDEVTQTTQVAEKAQIMDSEKELRILLAEDKKVSQKVIMLMLVKMGHKVMIAENGKEVLDLFEPGRYDLILMDIQMPEMDGITATKILKEKYEKLPPIVGLSANAFEGDREKYMDMGMDEYLTKPLKGNDIKELAKKLF